MSDKVKIISQDYSHAGTTCVIEFNTGLKVRLKDDGSVELKEMVPITDMEFAHIASVRYSLKNR